MTTDANIHGEASTEKDIASFYDVLAGDYDTMTGFDKRFVAERPYFRLITERYAITTAVDAGCGTGFHSVVLAQLGVSIVGVDVSPAMLQRLTEHARDLQLSIPTVQAGFENLAQSLPGKYDAVFCLGNSLAHLLSDDVLLAALSNFRSLLHPAGHLFLQLLNYDRVLAQRERVQHIKEAGEKTFVRFYDYEGDFVRFNILTLAKEGDTAGQSLTSITLNPVRRSHLENLLRGAGFTEISSFGGISLEPYTAETSKDLLVVATP